MQSIEPGISRFRVWSCGPSRNDSVWLARAEPVIGPRFARTRWRALRCAIAHRGMTDIGEIPLYMNPERGFATNIMFGPPAVDPKMRAELNDKYRKQTDGAREKR